MTRANKAAIIAAVEYLSEKKTVCPEDAIEAIAVIKQIPTTQRNSISKNIRRKNKKELVPVPTNGSN